MTTTQEPLDPNTSVKFIQASQRIFTKRVKLEKAGSDLIGGAVMSELNALSATGTTIIQHSTTRLTKKTLEDSTPSLGSQARPTELFHKQGVTEAKLNR